MKIWLLWRTFEIGKQKRSNFLVLHSLSNYFRSPDRRDRRDGSSARRSGGGGQGAYRGGGGGGGKSASNSRRAPPERRIFVSNIPFEMKWQEVKDLFRDNVGDVSYVELFNDENEKPRGCGILEFASEDLAKNAVDKMHRYEYKGRKLVVKEDFETERDKYGRIISSKGNIYFIFSINFELQKK